MKIRTQPLSLYLFLVSLLQICLYATWSFSPENFIALFYFDPRIGLFFIETWIRGVELRVPGILQWLSAFWLLLISILLSIGQPIFKTYVITEVILFVPNLFFFVVVVLANQSPAHGFSIGELFLPVLVSGVFSVVPLLLALRKWRELAQKRLSTPARAEQALEMDQR